MKKALRIISCIGFVISLLLTVFCTACYFAFNVPSVQNTLQRTGFYEKTLRQVEAEVTDLQSVINIETDAIMQALQSEQIVTLAENYTAVINQNLLTGSAKPSDLTFSSDALERLISDTITPSQYGDDTAALEADRADAYADLTAAVQQALAFFPQSLFDTAKEIAVDYGVPLQTFYDAVGYLQKAALPLAILTALLAFAVIYCHRENKPRALRTVAGLTTVPLSLFFFISIIMRGTSLFSRFSLADGLLKEYILALFRHVGDSAMLIIGIPFFIGVVTLFAAIIWEAASNKKNTCAQNETVIQ